MVMTLHPVFTYDPGQEVRIVETMASQLVPYVYQDELYGLMPNTMPRLTVGGLLMRLYRLTAVASQLTAPQQASFKTAQTKLETTKRDWPVAYEGKIAREFQSRITALNQSFAECADNPKQCAESYGVNAEKRAILQALADEAESLNVFTQDMKGGLNSVDNKIHRYTEPGEFIWSERVQSIYPKDKYFFLYVK
jgi:hypothetical protein